MTASSTRVRETQATVKVLGIRHHGPGSARSVRRALEAMAPDMVLLEGPPEADKLIQYVGNGLVPPVALLVYAPDNLKQACYYPFAEFSPEWQAMDYANKNKINCRFIDLSQSFWFGLARQNQKPELSQLLESILPDNLPEFDTQEELTPEKRALAEAAARQAEEDLLMISDPIGALARAAGYSDG